MQNGSRREQNRILQRPCKQFGNSVASVYIKSSRPLSDVDEEEKTDYAMPVEMGLFTTAIRPVDAYRTLHPGKSSPRNASVWVNKCEIYLSVPRSIRLRYIVLCKVDCTLAFVIVPDVHLIMAVYRWWNAQRLLQYLNQTHNSPKWTLTHLFFALSNGSDIHRTDSAIEIRLLPRQN